MELAKSDYDMKEYLFVLHDNNQPNGTFVVG